MAEAYKHDEKLAIDFVIFSAPDQDKMRNHYRSQLLFEFALSLAARLGPPCRLSDVLSGCNVGVLLVGSSLFGSSRLPVLSSVRPAIR